MADRVDRRRILLTSQMLQMFLAIVLGAAVGDRTGSGSRPSCSSPSSPASRSRSPRPTYQAVLTSVVPQRPHPQRGGAELAAVQPLARGGTGDRRRAAGPRRDHGLLRGERAVVPGRDHRALGHPDPARTPRPRTESLARSLGTGLRHVADEPGPADPHPAGRGRAASWPSRSSPTCRSSRATSCAPASPGTACCSPASAAARSSGAVTTAHRGNVPGRGRRLLLAMIVYGAVTAGAMACRDQCAAMALLVLSGVSMVTAFSTLNSLVQENAPDALKGRDPEHLRPRLPRRPAAGRAARGRARPSLRRAAGHRRVQRRPGRSWPRARWPGTRGSGRCEPAWRGLTDRIRGGVRWLAVSPVDRQRVNPW